MCGGVTKELAGIELSESPKKVGAKKTKENKIKAYQKIPTKSLEVK